MKHISKVVIFLLLPVHLFAYGEKQDTLPNWYERAVLTVTNICRLSPQEYRNEYLSTDNILLPAQYPPVPPLFWNYALNASSRYHAVEMAGSCGMQHDCNGIRFDERIRDFFNGPGRLGENIAMGYRTPQSVVNGWLSDVQLSGDTAQDGSGKDGHRANVMSSKFTVAGCGYFRSGTGGSVSRYWCQDLAESDLSMVKKLHGVPSASHLFIRNGKVTFVMNLYDNSLASPQVVVNLDGTRNSMELTFGSAGRGTYMLSLPVAQSCREYHFEVNAGNGLVWRYPEIGELLTTGEGDCLEDYTPESTSVSRSRINRHEPTPRITLSENSVCYHSDGTAQRVCVYTISGRIVTEIEISKGKKEHRFQIENSGSYIVTSTRSGHSSVTRFIVMY